MIKPKHPEQIRMETIAKLRVIGEPPAVPRPPSTHSKQQFYSYRCVKCGCKAENCYGGRDERMLKARLCFTCDFWEEKAYVMAVNHSRMTIIDGGTYSPGNETTGSFRGMAGRRFDIEYIPPSAFAGSKITTEDLWYGGKLPDELRKKYPDTARFLNGAQACGNCWNDSRGGTERFPAPRTLDLA